MSTTKPTVSTEIIPYIFYRDVPAALDWLARAFGFNEEMRHATPSGMHAQMTLDGQRIMMGQGCKEWGMLSPHEAKSATQGTFVYHPISGLAGWLRDKHALIVLDSCEHVLGAVAAIAEAILKAAAHISILATSREPLRAEVRMATPPLLARTAAALR